jgi:hypothetical protein
VERVEELNRMAGVLVQLEEEETDLEYLVEEARQAETDLERLDRAGQAGMVAVALGLEWAQAVNHERGLAILVGEGRKTEAFQGPPLDTSRLVKLRAEADALAEYERNLEALVGDARELEGRICQLDEAARVKGEELRKASDGKCPLCHQPVDDPSQFCAPIGTVGTNHRQPGNRTRSWGGLEY